MMNEGEGGRSFSSAKSLVEEDKAIENAIPASMRYKIELTVEVFREWQTSSVQQRKLAYTTREF